LIKSTYIAIILTDFNPKKSGILSTANGLIRQNPLISKEIIYSYNNPNFEKQISVLKLKKIVFSHLEHSNISKYLNLINPTLVHVGDWSISYRLNEFKNKKNLYCLFKLIYCFTRLKIIKPSIVNYNFIFVNKKESELAKKFGFTKSSHIDIGIDIPEKLSNLIFDPYQLTFSGNFDYNPNKEAAIQLIDFFKTLPDNYSLNIIGFNANNLKDYVQTKNSIRLFNNVESVIDKLNEFRGVYLSFIGYGSGSKNKILQALGSGCYVIASEESLDLSLANFKESIFEFNINKKEWKQEVKNHLENLILNKDIINEKTHKTNKLVISLRGWKVLSDKFNFLLNEINKK